jgi:branched-chain amino acid transport system permease protein
MAEPSDGLRPRFLLWLSVRFMTLLLQNLVNGLLLGGLYVCIAIGFSLIWGVLNIINLLHGSIIVLGSYIAFYAFTLFGISPFLAPLFVIPMMFAFGYGLQLAVLNRVVDKPVLITLTLTFGLDLILNNFMLAAFTANFRRIVFKDPFETLDIYGVIIPVDRVVAMALALVLTLAFYLLLNSSRIGRAIVAVRNDRDAAVLMGVNVKQIYAVTFGVGAAFAGAAGCLLSVVFPISPMSSGLYLGKAFVICVLGGLGSIGGALIGGLALGVIESMGVMLAGPEHSVLTGFLVLLAVLAIKPTGLAGKRGYE